MLASLLSIEGVVCVILKRQARAYIHHSVAAQTSIAENYIGLPI